MHAAPSQSRGGKARVMNEYGRSSSLLEDQSSYPSGGNKESVEGTS